MHTHFTMLDTHALRFMVELVGPTVSIILSISLVLVSSVMDLMHAFSHWCVDAALA